MPIKTDENFNSTPKQVKVKVEVEGWSEIKSLQEYRGRIILTEPGKKDLDIGTVGFQCIDPFGFFSYDSLWITLDCVSGQLIEIADRIVHKKSIYFNEVFNECYGDDDSFDNYDPAKHEGDEGYGPGIFRQSTLYKAPMSFLYLHEIRIDPKYRGNKYGLQALAQIITEYGPGNCGIFMRPCPIESITDKEEGREKLAQYYRLLGFRYIGEDKWGQGGEKDFMYIDLSTPGLYSDDYPKEYEFYSYEEQFEAYQKDIINRCLSGS